MNTIRRDKLMRDVEKGLYLAKCTIEFNAMTDGPEFPKSDWLPARVRKQKWETYTNENGYERDRCVDSDHKEGHVNFDTFDFRSGSGRAYANEDGTITLRVHSNCIFKLKKAVA